MIYRYPTTGEAAGLQAGATLRWLDQSGPRYREWTVVVMGALDDLVHVDDVERTRHFILSPAKVSIASWYILNQAKRLDTVSILVRIDKVGRCRTLEKA